jgi:hypothetical protein
MKKIMFGVLLSLFAVAAVKAQDDPDLRMQKKMRHMDLQKLNLSQEQKDRFRSANDEFRNEMQDLKKQDDITVKEWKSRMQKLRADHKEKIRGLLTNDQKEQLEKMKTGRKERSEAMSQKRMERMKQRLALTDAQSDKLNELRTDMSAKLKTLKENNSLTRDQKRDQVKELMRQRKEKMSSILTTDQLKKLKEGKHQGHRRKQRV